MNSIKTDHAHAICNKLRVKIVHKFIYITIESKYFSIVRAPY